MFYHIGRVSLYKHTKMHRPRPSVSDYARFCRQMQALHPLKNIFQERPCMVTTFCILTFFISFV